MEDFVNVGKIKDWEMWIDNVPKTKGVYVITRKSEAYPIFLEKGTEGIFKGKPPVVNKADLEEKWARSNKEIMYIGRANKDYMSNKMTLQKRLKMYMGFGFGKDNVYHFGGRYIWHLKDVAEFDVWYKVCENPETIESNLIDKYKPFANLKREK